MQGPVAYDHKSTRGTCVITGRITTIKEGRKGEERRRRGYVRDRFTTMTEGRTGEEKERRRYVRDRVTTIKEGRKGEGMLE